MQRTLSQLITVAVAVSACAIGEQALAAAADQLCAKDDDVRLIEIRFTDDGDLPCKVIYRPAVESETVGTVSWQDIADLSVCLAKADEVIARLVSEGWTCDSDRSAGGGESVVATGLLAEGALAYAASEQDVAEASTSQSARLPTAEIQSDDVGEQSQAVDEVDRPARFVESPDLPPPPDDLAAMILDDLNRLDTTLDGQLEAEIAAYGDLNADDVGDALVLYTYNSPQPAYRQFLVAYVFDGETYQLTATRPVSGHVSATMDARVEAIDSGVIHVALQSFEPGDASCCPSGTRRLALTLRELDLVEIDADAPTR